MSAISIRKLVSDDYLSKIRSAIAKGPYVPDPAAVAYPGTKPSVRLDPRSEASARAAELLVAGCRETAAFLAATWVEAMMAPSFHRHEPGASQAPQLDSAFVGEPPNQLRCDIAVS